MTLNHIGAIDLWVEEGGTNKTPTLLLMHGLSGTGNIWQGLKPFLQEKWPGRWLIPDMRGHGRSGHSTNYSLANHATDMSALLVDSEEVYLAGHSMGGLVGILLASGWFGVSPKAVITTGVKVNWSEEEYSGILKLIRTPARWFNTEEEARERFILVTGLRGIVDPNSEFAQTGIVENNGKWRLAADNRTAMVALANAGDVYNAAKAPILLSAGEHDQMVAIEELRSLDRNALQLAGLGHNAHVENPKSFWNLIATAAGVST
mgnify:FL=1